MLYEKLYFSYKHIKNLKVKGYKKIYHENGYQNYFESVYHWYQVDLKAWDIPSTKWRTLSSDKKVNSSRIHKNPK